MRRVDEKTGRLCLRLARRVGCTAPRQARPAARLPLIRLDAEKPTGIARKPLISASCLILRRELHEWRSLLLQQDPRHPEGRWKKANFFVQPVVQPTI